MRVVHPIKQRSPIVAHVLTARLTAQRCSTSLGGGLHQLGGCGIFLAKPARPGVRLKDDWHPVMHRAHIGTNNTSEYTLSLKRESQNRGTGAIAGSGNVIRFCNSGH